MNAPQGSTGLSFCVGQGLLTLCHIACRAVNASLPVESAAGSATAPSSVATEDISTASASSAEVVARWVVVFQDETPDSEIAQYCSSSAATYGFTCKTQLSLLMKAIVTEVRLVCEREMACFYKLYMGCCRADLSN